MTQAPLFNPRLVPVSQVDGHLPALGPDRFDPVVLRRRFASAPSWQPELVSEPRFSSRPPQAASVLVPLVLRERLTVLLTQRTDHLSSHSGQIAFPGGKADEEDADAAATALREAQEEIGLAPHLVDVIGTMPIYSTGSGFHVTPVVALVQPTLRYEPNPHEVADVFEVPLEFLMNPAHHRHHTVDWEGRQRQWLSMPYTGDDGRERFIWGATAGMLRNLYQFLSL